MVSSAILLDNPRDENQSWEDWGLQLAEKYKTPALTPGLPVVPGQTTFRTYLSDLNDQLFPVKLTLFVNS